MWVKKTSTQTFRRLKKTRGLAIMSPSWNRPCERAFDVSRAETTSSGTAFEVLREKAELQPNCWNFNQVEAEIYFRGERWTWKKQDLGKKSKPKEIKQKQGEFQAQWTYIE